jgi:hypothetical protein
MPLAIAVALLPTPTVGDSASAANRTAGRSNPDSKHHDGTTLTDWVRLLPTPTVGDGEGGGVRTGLTWERATQSTGDGGASRLRDVVGMLLPTPTTQDATNTAGPSQRGRHTPPPNSVVTTLPLIEET